MIQWGSRARPPRLQGGQAPLSRALPRTGHAAAWLRGAAVKWTRPRRTHPFSSMFPLSGRFVFFSSPNSDEPRPQIRRAQHLSHQIELSAMSATSLRTQSTTKLTP